MNVSTYNCRCCKCGRHCSFHFVPLLAIAVHPTLYYTPQCVGPAGRRDAYYVVLDDVLVMFRGIMQHEVVVCGTRVYLRGEYVHRNWPRRSLGQDKLGGRSQLVSVLGSSQVKPRHRRGKKSSRGHCCHLCRLTVEGLFPVYTVWRIITVQHHQHGYYFSLGSHRSHQDWFGKNNNGSAIPLYIDNTEWKTVPPLILSF